MKISRGVTAIQTHNAVSIPLSSWNTDVYRGCDGFSTIGVTLMNDAATAMSLSIRWSHDGTTYHGLSTPISNSTAQRVSVETPVLAPYFAFSVNNGDGAAAHTMSAWAYLKG